MARQAGSRSRKALWFGLAGFVAIAGFCGGVAWLCDAFCWSFSRCPLTDTYWVKKNDKRDAVTLEFTKHRGDIVAIGTHWDAKGRHCFRWKPSGINAVWCEVLNDKTYGWGNKLWDGSLHGDFTYAIEGRTLTLTPASGGQPIILEQTKRPPLVRIHGLTD